MLRLTSLTLSLAAFLLGQAPAGATTQDDVLRASILSGWATGACTRMAALHLELAPGWKTYWRAPGDAGIPPLLDWSGSDNVAAIRLHWPRPVVFDLNGMTSIGYHDDLVLPVEVTPKDASQPVTLRLRADLGICKDICMPAMLQIEAQLDAAAPDEGAIRAALAARPAPADQGRVTSVACQVEPIRDGLRITARIALPDQGGTEAVVFEPGRAGVWVSEAETQRQGGGLTAVADMVPPEGRPFSLERGKLTLTVIGTDSAVEITGCPAP